MADYIIAAKIPRGAMNLITKYHISKAIVRRYPSHIAYTCDFGSIHPTKAHKNTPANGSIYDALIYPNHLKSVLPKKLNVSLIACCITKQQ